MTVTHSWDHQLHDARMAVTSCHYTTLTSSPTMGVDTMGANKTPPKFQANHYKIMCPEFLSGFQKQWEDSVMMLVQRKLHIAHWR
jgi:hypothetical protein